MFVGTSAGIFNEKRQKTDLELERIIGSNSGIILSSF
jgi:hypothetical protein